MSLKDPNVVSKSHPKQVAIVIANPAISTTTQWPVGFWWSELSHPYYVLTEAGYEIEVFSPDGGKCEGDGMSDPRDPSGYSASDLISMGFICTPKLADLITNTKKVADIDSARFDAIIVAGGQSPMFTFEKATGLHKKFVEFYEKGKIACALCHGTAILRYAKLSNGEYLAQGKTVTGFAIKRRVNAKQGFREFHAARRTIQGYEAIHMLRKGQVRWVSGTDVRPQNQFIDKAFEMTA
jgi:putative intracellular protease/amidase